MIASPPGAAAWARGGPARLAVALDTADADRARALAAAVAPHCDLLKVGLELFAAAGPELVRRLGEWRPIFLDLKLHDIPNTIAGAVRALLPLRPALLTLHAAGGAAMFAAARAAAETVGDERPRLLAVTVLTSLDAAALAATGVGGGPAEQVARLARLAVAAGADGLVCAASEVAALRAEFGPDVPLVVPGIRPEGDPSGDQARVATPAAAVAAGADILVVGRPITGAADPGAACAAIVRAMGAACRSR